ncbi:MAG: hypothetical protein QM704_02645 [Anaeromyxobacteraceae bacterium]
MSPPVHAMAARDAVAACLFVLLSIGLAWTVAGGAEDWARRLGVVFVGAVVIGLALAAVAAVAGITRRLSVRGPSHRRT